MTVAKESGNRLLIDDALAKSGKRTVSAYEVSHVMTLLGLVEAGLGVAAVPRLAMPLKGHSTLASVLLEQPRVTRSLGLISRRGRPLAPAAQQLYNLIDQTGKSAKRKPSPGRPPHEPHLPGLATRHRRRSAFPADAAQGDHDRAPGPRRRPQDDEHHLARIRHHFSDAQIVWFHGRPAGLFKAYRDPAGWRLVQIQIDPAFQGQGLGRRLLAGLLEQADAEARR